MLQTFTKSNGKWLKLGRCREFQKFRRSTDDLRINHLILALIFSIKNEVFIKKTTRSNVQFVLDPANFIVFVMKTTYTTLACDRTVSPW